MKIPCLSLWQPWATLMAIGAKKNETRSWPTSYRGPLAIHAAKKWTKELAAIAKSEPFRSSLVKGGLSEPYLGLKAASCFWNQTLPFGAIVCIVNVLDCFPTWHEARSGKGGCLNPEVFPDGFTGNPEDEIAFGDYSPGRFFFRTELVKRFETPIPCVGRQGMFEVEIPEAGR